ncbi:MAG: UDP-glucose 4-epimerase, partial [Chloroflexota bacterium]
HEQDAIAAALLAADHPLAPGKIFNVTDGEVHSVKEILDAMSAGLGRRPIAWHVPMNWIQPGVKFADALLQLAGRNGLAQAMLNKYLEDVAVSGAKFQRELGFRPRYDLLSGWRQTLDEMKLSGQL